jgi:hypothetical protein
MIANRIEGATRLMGRDQPGYTTVPVRDETIRTIDEDGSPCESESMLSSWQPTPAELEKLAAGAPVTLRILGRGWPPLILGVGEVP